MAAPIVMDVDALRRTPGWRRAVWATRGIFVGIVIIMVGVLIHGQSRSAGTTLLTVGFFLLIADMAIALIELTMSFRSLPEPRPRFLGVRWILVRDAFRRGPRA